MILSVSERISSIFEQLDLLDVQLSKSSESYELITNQMGDELVIQGDVAGLVHLARQVLYVGKSNVPGKHMSFDDCSDLTECNGKFIIGFKPTSNMPKET